MNLFTRKTDEPELRGGIVWNRAPEDVATRIEAGDVGGLFNREINIADGTNALILVDGSPVANGIVEPGRHTLSSLGQRIAGLLTLSKSTQVTALIVDTNDLLLPLRVEAATTKDPLLVKADIEVRLRIPVTRDVNGRVLVNRATQTPHLVDFLRNVLKDRRRYTLGDLALHLQPEVDNAVQEFVRRYTAADLNGDLQKKATLEASIEAHLSTTFAREGFEFIGVRAVRIVNDQLSALNAQRQELLLLAAKEEFELDKRKTLYGFYEQGQLQDLVEDSKRVEFHEKRYAIQSRLRKAVSGDKMDELRTEADLRKFLDEQDREKLLGAADRDKLLFELRSAGEDRERARAMVLARLNTESTYELKMLEVRLKGDLDSKQLEDRQKFERSQVEFAHQQELMRVEGKLAIDRAERSHQRAQSEQDAASKRVKELEDARNTAAVRSTQRVSDEEDAAMGLRVLDNMKRLRQAREEEAAAGRRKDEAETRKIRLEDDQARLEMDLRKQKAQHDMDMEKRRHELEAQVQVRGLENQRRKDDMSAYREMDASKIVATNVRAEDAGAVLTARAEAEAAAAASYSAEARRREQQLLDEVRSGAKSSGKAEAQEDAIRGLRDELHEQRKLVRDLNDTSRHTVVGVAQAGDKSGPTVVVAGAGGGAQVVGGSNSAASGAKLMCPNPTCSRENDPEKKFCGHCGTKLRQ